MKNYRIVDLFAGIGGLRTGVINGIISNGYTAEIVFTSEIKKTALITLKDNYDEKEIHGDIRNINEKDVPDHEILIAGFPCQAFSMAGTRKGFLDSTKGTLFFDVARILKEKQPEYFILENVEGLIRHDPDPDDKKSPTGRTMKIILSTLKSLGYNVDWKLLNAKDFGVPQARKRIFITGSKSSNANMDTLEYNTSLPISSILETNKKETDKKVIGISNLLLSHYSEKYLLGKILRDKRGGVNNIHSWNIEYKGKTTHDERTLLELLVGESKKKSWAILKKIPYRECMALTKTDMETFFTPQNQSLDEILNNLTRFKYLIEEHNGWRIYSGKLSMPISRIQDPDKYAITLVATDADRIGIMDNGSIRRLTNIEIKRLFGFPDNFILNPKLSRSQIFDLFGNSVVISVAETVTKNLVRP